MSPATNLLQEIVGQTMWTSRRAADMATFQFGRRIDVLDFYGRPTQVGEYALHVQCTWRVVKADRLIVGSQDLYYPAGDGGDEPIPEGFDWDRDPNRRDQLLSSMFEGPALVVRRVAIGQAGMCRVEFDEGIVLELFPANSDLDEHWRLFDTQTKGRTHFVMRGSTGGVALQE